MPVFEFEDPKVKVTIVDEPTVEQQLTFTYGLMRARQADNYFVRQWDAVLPLITEWECEIFPDRSVPLSELTDPQITEVVIWVCSRVSEFINNLGEVSKKRNSAGGGSGGKGNESDS